MRDTYPEVESRLSREEASSRAKSRGGEVWASVGALLEVIERERAGLELFGQRVEMLSAGEQRLQAGE